MKSRERPEQYDLFRKPDPDEGKRRRDEGKERVLRGNEEWIAKARATMVQVIEKMGECSSDDCWRFCPPPEDAHPSILGCLFDDNRFVRVGDRLSQRPSAHSRRIGVYELRHKPNGEK